MVQQWFLDPNSGGDSTASMGSRCSCLTAPSEKKFFLTCHLNLLWYNFRTFPLFLKISTISPFGEIQRIISNNIPLLHLTCASQ